LFTRSPVQLAGDERFDNLARLVGLRARLSHPFVHGILEQVILAVAAGGLVERDERSRAFRLRGSNRVVYDVTSKLPAHNPTGVASVSSSQYGPHDSSR
jgi:hypothetical protein